MKEHSFTGTLIQRISFVKTQGNLALNYFFLTWRLFLFFYFFLIFWSPGTTPDAPIGLWTLSPRFSAVLSQRSIFPTAQRFSRSNHVTSGLNHVTSGDVTSGSGHVISGHFRFQKRSVVSHYYAQPHNQSHIRTGGVYAN